MTTPRGHATDAIETIGSAYKVHPIMTGLLLLNISTFIGIGWYVSETDKALFAEINRRDVDRQAFRDKAVDLLSKCIVPENPWRGK